MSGYQDVLEGAQQLSPEEQEQLYRDLEALVKSSANQEPTPKKNRTPGLSRGQMWIGDDFNDPLPDEYLGISS